MPVEVSNAAGLQPSHTPPQADAMRGPGQPQARMRKRTGCCFQWTTLIRRKEIPLKTNRLCSSVCEVVLPLLLCAIVALGAAASERDKYMDTLYAPTTAVEAVQNLGFAEWGRIITSGGIGVGGGSNNATPTVIPPLSLYLAYASLYNRTFGVATQPYSGTYLAVTPDTPSTRHVMASVIGQQPEPWVQAAWASPSSKLLTAGLPPSLRAGGLPPLSNPGCAVRYFGTEREIEELAKDAAPIWAAVVLTQVPDGGRGTWKYKLRSNFTAIPQLRRKYDRFPDGLSDEFFDYYKSGFLSLQVGLNEFFLQNASSSASLPLAYGVPFPVPAYESNTFFSFAGNLIGLVVIFSFLIPIGTSLRALVLEREARQREQLLISGTTLPAYYGGILTAYGFSYLLTSFICALIISPFCFTYSSPLLVILLFLLFSLASLSFVLALSPFFRNARVASLAGPLIFFLTSQIYYAFLERGELVEGNNGGKALASLFPSMGFYLAASLMAQYEGSQQGVTLSNVNEVGAGFSVGTSMGLLFFDIFLWLMVAWYLDQVVPSEYGLQRRPWFLCTPSYWCGGSAATAPSSTAPSESEVLQQASTASESVIEPLPEDVGSSGGGVVTMGLRKVFQGTPAVHGLDLQMARGQVTGLLGANGAGKTTTISMLTGLIPPTSGTATINGLSIATHMRSIRYSLGVCPQQNVLFDPLSCSAHLRLYGALKGLAGRALDETIRKLLLQVLLSEKAGTAARSLSGGQKRKLCLAISLIGDAQTIILDEPTSGMDPHSRRAIWGLLREQREERTIVLTTHFLDEADILSDRIVIMAEGRLQCAGSSLFLKQALGTGYTLALTKASTPAKPFDGTALLSQLRSHVADASLVSESPVDALVKLPGDNLQSFQALFETLEASREDLGVAEYGATCTTLEDVFLRINDKSLKRLAEQERAHLDTSASAPEPAAATVDPVDPVDRNGEAAAAHVRGGKLRMYAGLVTKRRLSARRDWCTTGCMILFPVLLVLFALLLLDVAGGVTDDPEPERMLPDVLFPKDFGPSIPRPVPLPIPPDNAALAFQADLDNLGWGVSVAPAASTSSNAFPTVAANMSSYLLANPDETKPAALAYSPSMPIPNTTSSVDVASLFFNSTSYHALPAMVQSLYTALVLQASGSSSGVEGTVQPLPLSNDDQADIANFVSLFASILILIPFAFIAAQFVAPVLRERESGSKQMQFISGVGGLVYWLSSWSWDACMFLIIEAFTLVVFAGQGRDEFTGSEEAFGATTLLLLLFGASVLTLSSAASFLFKTPSSGLLAMSAFHFVTGFGFVIADFVLSQISSTESANGALRNVYRFFPAYCLGQGFLTLATRDAIARTASSVAAGGLRVYEPPGVYEWDQLGALVTYLILEALAFGLLTLALQYSGKFVWLRQLLFNRGAGRAGGEQEAAMGAGAEAQMQTMTVTVPAGLGAGMQMQVQSPSGRAFHVAVPPGVGPGQQVQVQVPEPPSALGLEDESVQQERRAVDAGELGGHLLALKHLRKVFTTATGGVQKVAVHDLCLRVAHGECFGFLGVNGAGKTTTFGMLTGTTVPTSGDATLAELSILTAQDQIRRRVGYCPQHDALEKLMTPRETLRMYARIKEVPASQVSAAVEELLADLDLLKFAATPAGKLSGGNKRKLCVGIALVGGPQLVLLDEPSSGMDAASKRFLWSVIKRRTHRSCTLLTTHSMEECEALCRRIGVMVDGQLCCLGPIQSLKSRYGQGHKIDLRLDPALADPGSIVGHLQSRCGGIELTEYESPSMVLSVPRGAAALPQLFAMLTELKTSHHVKECSVTQCTLEQVFILMASKSKLMTSATGPAGVYGTVATEQ